MSLALQGGMKKKQQPQVSTRSGGRRDTGDHPSRDMH